MGLSCRRLALLCIVLCFVSSLDPVSLRAAGSDDADFEQWEDALSNEFQSHVSAEEQAFEAYKKEIEQQWQAFAGSTQKDWVAYSDDKSTRSLVDFKAGEIILETVISVDPQKKPLGADGETLERIAKRRLQKRLQEILLDQSVIGQSPIAGQVLLGDGEALSPANLSQFVTQKLKHQIKIEAKPYLARDGKKRVQARVRVKMMPDHLKLRAEKFRTPIEIYSKKYGVDASLVMAVIHTESYFNPKARSHAPAYGLMQLVPRSGGRAAYRRVHGKDRAPSSAFLYDPNNNIELGTAYLDLLAKRDFKHVKDEQSRTYLIIAAYNTGAGNVSRALTGKKNIRKAIKKINKMSPERLFATLKRDLPYKETRDYLQKVVKRQAIYQDF